MGVLGRIRRAVRWVGNLPDRALHSRRAGEALARATSRGMPASVVVVCYGNICRSPYAEGVLRRSLASGRVDGVSVGSAGLYGPDRPANETALRLARARGVDLSAHRSRLFGAEDVTREGLVVVMTEAQREELIRGFGVPPERVELLGDFDPMRPEQRDIPDPYGHPDPVFERVFERIDRCVEAMCQAWKGAVS